MYTLNELGYVFMVISGLGAVWNTAKVEPGSIVGDLGVLVLQ